MADKREGQIWIGRREPYTVKYQAGGTEYWLQSISTYEASGTIPVGQIVALDAASSRSVVPAVWPRDAARVVGLALNGATNGETVRVGSDGFFRFDTVVDLKTAFVTHSDLDPVTAPVSGAVYYSAFGNVDADGGGGNNWLDAGGSKNGRGQPVYWYTGRTLRTGAASYSWQDPSTRHGRLTFATPTGYKGIAGTSVAWADPSFDVTYEHLPQVGTVADYEYTGSELTSLTIHLNISLFQKRIQFHYPASGLGQFIGTPTAPPSEDLITVRHGLFPTGTLPHIDLTMWGYEDATITAETTGETTRIYPGYDSYLTTNEQRTEISIQSDTSFYYKIRGEIVYTN